MNLALFVDKWARATPERPAVALGDRTVLDYASLAGRVARLAGGLAAAGLTRGDRVAMVMRNTPEYFECLFAVWHAGLVAVPVNAKLHPRETAFILDHARVSLCFASPGLVEEPSGARLIEVPSADHERLATGDAVAPRPLAPDALAWLFYTSGTTGRPKGAMLTHRNLLTMCLCYVADVDDEGPWRAILHPAPLSHGSGLYALPHLMKGSCQVVPESGSFEPAEIFDLIGAWKDCVFFAAPTMVRRLTAFPEDRDAGGLKTVMFGGAPMHVADIEACLDRFGPRLAQLYGLGETPMTITAVPRSIYADRGHPDWRARLASAGRPQSAVEVMVVDSDGRPVAGGEVGEIVCRSDCVMRGYWRDERSTAEALRDGWLWTGDMGRLDDAGFLTLSGRSKDLIISGGANIYPREIEEVLLRHPAVVEVSVIGRPDREWGEVVIAYVAPAPGLAPDAAALDRLCLDAIARFKRPRAYRFVPELPKNNYGKIVKNELREWEKGEAPPAGRCSAFAAPTVSEP